MSESDAALEACYDEVPYVNRPCTQSHVRRLEAVAALFGAKPQPITQARVLEIGCAAGHNLLPQAEEFPGSSFVGFDLAQTQVAEGQALLRALGLKNIELRQASITEVDESWGQFDYIVCHGVYSWVPPDVQDGILRICERNLAPRGVAHISYNVYPGWHQRSQVREMLQYHTARFRSVREKIAQARAWLKFLVETTPADTTLGRALHDEQKLVQHADDSYFYHEHFEPFNAPLYFHEFARRLAGHQLQFLGEVNLPSMLPVGLPAAVQEKLAPLGLVEQQQYLDFVRNRPFRESLICHENVPLVRRLTPAVMEQFSVSTLGDAKPPAGDLTTSAPTPFVFGGVTLTVVNPLVKAALTHLMRVLPEAVPFERLWQTAVEQLPGNLRPQTPAAVAQQRTDLAATLLMGLCNGLFDCAVHPPQYVSLVSHLPEAGTLARAQAAQSDCVTNRRHEHVQLDAVCRHVLCRLDGRHTLADLAASVHEAAALAGGNEKGERNARMGRDDATRLVQRAVEQMRRGALLVR